MQVEHFSKYGLEDSDEEEMDVVKPVGKNAGTENKVRFCFDCKIYFYVYLILYFINYKIPRSSILNVKYLQFFTFLSSFTEDYNES